MTVAMFPELIAELDAVVKTGSPGRGDRILRQVTSLFLSNVDCLGEAQLSVLDDVLVHLIEQTEAPALADPSRSLSEIEEAPRKTIRRLAFHNDPSVAAPVLRSSSRLSENDLIEIAKTLNQQHLLAISERKTLSETLTDVLMRRGNAGISNALAHNPGAVFSECGYATLVGRAERDECLTEKLGLRLDLPANLLRELLAKATDVVRAQFLTASRPISRQNVPAQKNIVKTNSTRTDYTQAQKVVLELNRTGKLNISAVNRFATGCDYTKVVAAVSLLTDVKIEAIEPLIDSDRFYALIVACRAARLDWSTTRMIIRNRPGCPPISQRELEQAQEIFNGLLLSIAQWTVRFGSNRMQPGPGP